MLPILSGAAKIVVALAHVHVRKIIQKTILKVQQRMPLPLTPGWVKADLLVIKEKEFPFMPISFSGYWHEQ